MKSLIKINQKLVVDVIDLTYEGMGVAKYSAYPIFIDGALPGDKIIVQITKLRKNFGYAKIIKWIDYSKDRVFNSKQTQQLDILPLFHLKYNKQLAFKQHNICQLLKKKNLNIGVKFPISSLKKYYYRNKSQVPVRKINGKLKVGFYRKNSHDFIPLKNFIIQDKKIDVVLQIILDILNKYNLSAYDEINQSGLIRHLMIRRGYYSKEIMVVIVTNNYNFPHGKQIAKAIMNKCLDVKSVIQNVNSKNTNVILGNTDILLAGRNFIYDQLNSLTFRISSHAFYQINPLQTELLYNKAIEMANLNSDDIVIDAYCGIGTISLSIARKVKEVYGVEIVADAIRDAQFNSKLNNISNAHFEVGDAGKWILKWYDKGIHPSIVIVDPPRKGLSNDFITHLLLIKPKKIIYISCNPATLVRDIELFISNDYQVHQPIVPVDQFPQTAHVESVTVLERKK